MAIYTKLCVSEVFWDLWDLSFCCCCCHYNYMKYK